MQEAETWSTWSTLIDIEHAHMRRFPWLLVKVKADVIFQLDIRAHVAHARRKEQASCCASRLLHARHIINLA